MGRTNGESNVRHRRRVDIARSVTRKRSRTGVTSAVFPRQVRQIIILHAQFSLPTTNRIGSKNYVFIANVLDLNNFRFASIYTSCF